MSNASPLPFSPAADNNKDPILHVLQALFVDPVRVLEIGSGTGQHAVHMAHHLPHVTWQASDVPQHLAGIEARIAQEGTANALPPIALDVARHPWPVDPVGAIYSANVIHIISWPRVEDFFHGVGQVLAPKGTLCLYGPYKYDGQYTTESNANFDDWLRDRDPDSGIKDFEAVNELALAQKLVLLQDHAMPANNQLIVWRREG